MHSLRVKALQIMFFFQVKENSHGGNLLCVFHTCHVMVVYLHNKSSLT